MTPAIIFIVVIQTNSEYSNWIKVIQIILFVISIYGYFQIAGYAQEKDDNSGEQNYT
jgi:hypothetical protein